MMKSICPLLWIRQCPEGLFRHSQTGELGSFHIQDFPIKSCPYLRVYAVASGLEIALIPRKLHESCIN